MTATLFQNARLIDPERGTAVAGSLLVADGLIKEVLPQGLDTAGKTFPAGKVVDCRGLCLAPGIVDLGAKVSEPGERHKESFRTAGLAAAAGGVTTIVTRPDTQPAIDTPETLDYVRRRAAAETGVRVAPMAALTKGREGREMTEIAFLRDAGAVAFTDADRVVTDARVFSRCLT